MTIYLDIVLLENILLNYIIILSTAIISKEKINFIRIILSSIVGGVCAIVTYVTELSIFWGIVIKGIISIIMMKLAFQECKLSKFIKTLVFFYLVSFTFGGIAFMLLFFISPQNLIISENRFVGTYPLKITVLAGGIGFIIISIVAQIIKNKMTKKNMICELEIFYRGKNKKLKTMLDTGNLLKEPISNADVIIVEKESLKDFISNDILENINTILKGNYLEEKNIRSYRIKIIPFSSLGNDNGLLIGFKPDYIKIYGEDEIIRNDIIIGIYNGKLTRNDMYTSLIGLDILEKNMSVIKWNIKYR